MRKPPGIPNELFAYERKKRHWTQGDVADKINAPDERLVRRWEHGEVAPTPHYRGKLAEVFGKSARALGFPPDGQIPFWHMPYRRNAFFTGREDILQLLRDTFLAHHASPVPRLPLALSGLPGVGKSQIALEYACRYREHYHTVLWLHATSYQDLVADITVVADLLDLPGKDATNSAQLIESLKEWLTQLTRWLLIFDNVENLQLLDEFLPAEIKGHLLLTSRAQNTGTHAYRISVEPMGNNTGAELLLHRAKLLAIESTLEYAADAALARSLSEDMGGLPLALDQAGAYIEETAVSLSEYVKRYQEERRNLLDRRGSWAGDSEHPLSVAATFRLSFDKAAEQHPLAMDILCFCAFLQPDAIPGELFQHIESFKYGTTAFDEAIADLLRYSLIRRNTQEETFSMHRLVQMVLIDAMLPDLQSQWKEVVVLELCLAFQDSFTSSGEWPLNVRLLPHVLSCAKWTEDELSPTPAVGSRAGWIFHNSGNYLHSRGQLSESETLVERALILYKRHFGVEDPHTARALNDLSVIYSNQGKDDQALPLLVQALLIWVKYSNTEHPDISDDLFAEIVYGHTQTLFNLGMISHRDHMYKEAEEFLRRALSIQMKYLGNEHPDTARSLYMLAIFAYEQGKSDQQTQAFAQQAINIWENAEHADRALPILVGAVYADNQGLYDLADTFYQQALNIQEQQLGPNHPEVQPIKRAYADFLRRRGRDAEAAALEADDKSV